MRKNFLEDKFRKTLEQIELIEPGMKWMIDDLRSMRVSFRNSGVNIEEILENKDSLIKEVWKIGKAHELFTKGLLNIDGSLTSNAFDYLDKQKRGVLPSGALGDVAIEFSVHKVK